MALALMTELNQCADGFGVQPDRKDTRRNVLGFSQSGLGLPDRDDYFRSD